MRKSRYSEHQIVSALKQGVAVKAICGELGISPATFYRKLPRQGDTL